MKTSLDITNPKAKVEYHPILKRVLPKAIIKISEDYSISQYLLIFLLVGVGMGFFLLLSIIITRWSSIV
jgi:hypothetical protein